MIGKRGFILIGIGLAAALGGAWAYARSQRPLLELGVGYGARVACACRYIGNRPLANCYKDFEPGMEVIRLAEDRQTRAVTAYVPLVGPKRSVSFDPLLGCQAEALRR
jgi:hypothetical protein